MHQNRRPRPPWRAALVALISAAAVLGLAVGVSQALEMRGELSPRGESLEAIASDLSGRIGSRSAAETRAILEGAPVAARVRGPAGRIRLQTGDDALWSAGDPTRFAALATTAVSGWSLRAGALEVVRPLAPGGSLVVRAPLPDGAGTVGAANRALVVIGLLSLLVAGAAWAVAARSGRRLRGVALAAEAAAAGRASSFVGRGRGEWLHLHQAVGALSERAADLQRAAEAGVEALGAALAPLAHPVSARTPSGGLIRNDALERLIASLPAADAALVDDAVRVGLSASGPVSRRLVLAEGRSLEMEGWAVPGGRVVAVGERTEQARMEVIRRQITGAAARHLQAPVSEIQALGADLLGQVSGPALPTVRRIQAAGDRMERLVSQLLRGTANDPRARSVRLRPVGVAGVAYGLGASFDRRLRDRGLRLETTLPGDLPPVRTDAALLHEILSELISNAATFTPRGGTITLSARALPGGRVEITVLDTGPGIRPDELGIVTERFARGAGANGFPGAGLGLGVAVALAERLGGRLVLEGGPGGTARLELPAALVPAQLPAEPAPTDPPRLETPTPVAVP